ncbi:hypothetical protein GLP31_18430 [Photobacterium carnosum]|uniref:hypothetical protein n=1 Tax=Photobacterium carnosum TaxID=2023717 RepID=UPI001E5F04A7|nr:hypothetical protein [Photobacterium carnosum]MCD9554447.1 hypothetical protein [Photobacterium carnosum]
MMRKLTILSKTLLLKVICAFMIFGSSIQPTFANCNQDAIIDVDFYRQISVSEIRKYGYVKTGLNDYIDQQQKLAVQRCENEESEWRKVGGDFKTLVSLICLLFISMLPFLRVNKSLLNK